MNYLTDEFKKKITDAVLEAEASVLAKVKAENIGENEDGTNSDGFSEEEVMSSALYEIQDFLGDFSVNVDDAGISIGILIPD